MSVENSPSISAVSLPNAGATNRHSTPHDATLISRLGRAGAVKFAACLPIFVIDSNACGNGRQPSDAEASNVGANTGLAF